MPGRLLSLVLPAALLAAAPTTGEVDIRRVNNDRVVLEGVPEIPPRIGHRLNRYFNIRGASFQSWTEDGEGLFVITRFGDVAQLHRLSSPGGARRQLTFFTEPVRAAERRPGDSELLLRMDEGGGEFFQLFLFDPDGGEHRRLTDGRSRNGSALWSRDGARLAFQSTRRNGAANDIWLLDPARPEEARLILEAPDGASWAPSDWNADGRSLLIRQYVSINDSRVHLLDVESGERRLLAGGDDEPGNHTGVTPVFDASGEGFFSATDVGGEFRRLVHTRIATGERRSVTTDIPWDVRQLTLSDDRTRGAFVVNENGIDRLFLLDPTSLEHRPVENLPTGLFGGLTFSPDGRRLAMNLNTSQTPSDAYSLELGAGPLEAAGLTRWTHSEVGGLDSDSFVVPELVHFPTFDEIEGKARQIPAFVYLPPGDGPFPVIVSIHGGPEGQYRPGFRSQVQMWLDLLGAAVVAPNVRGSSGYGKSYLRLDNGFGREDSVKDIGALLDWLDTRDDLDGSRVAVYGGSYGGYMVLASLVHYSDRLRAGVDIVGISNFVSFLENTQDYRRDLRRVEYGDERDPAMRAFLERISPNRNAAKITVPLFVAQGQNDPRVPVTESEQIVREVREAGYDVWYMNALNEGHGFRKKENRDLYQQIVLLFLRRHLLGSGIEGAG
jgi:dipeptidyl aminopeptidase/acylaminoacyl peptidase